MYFHRKTRLLLLSQQLDYHYKNLNTNKTGLLLQGLKNSQTYKNNTQFSNKELKYSHKKQYSVLYQRTKVNTENKKSLSVKNDDLKQNVVYL